MARFPSLRTWLGGRTSTQLAAGMAILAALALTGSLLITGWAVRMDQRQQAALAALADYAAMVSKLGSEASLTGDALTEADAAYLSAWLSAFQSGPARDARTLEETCRTGRGGAGVRFIRTPFGKPAGLAALETARAERISRLGEDLYLIRLDRGELCPGRAVETVVVRRTVGSLDIRVGRVVDRSGDAWGWAVLAVGVTGVLILVSGLTAAFIARRRLSAGLDRVSRALDRAAVGDLSIRAPEAGAAPELTELTVQVNRTLDRLQELLTWLRDSSDQLAHDFRTPLARASARLETLSRTGDPARQAKLAGEARRDLEALTRAMNETLALRDGEAWVFEPVRLDRLAASAHDLYQPLAETRDVSISIQVEPVSVLGVASLLQRAVANLTDNAVKFSPDGGRVEIRVWVEDGRPCLCVADQGPGIDPRVLDDPAFRSGVGEVESHGMGLPFVRAILKRHGAAMTIEDADPGAIVTARFSR